MHYPPSQRHGVLEGCVSVSWMYAPPKTPDQREPRLPCQRARRYNLIVDGAIAFGAVSHHLHLHVFPKKH